MSIQPVNKAAEHLINSTPILEKKRFFFFLKSVNAYLIKNSKGWGVTITSSRKNLVEFYGCIKLVSNDQSLQWQSPENASLSLSERDTELELELENFILQGL